MRLTKRFSIFRDLHTSEWGQPAFSRPDAHDVAYNARLRAHAYEIDRCGRLVCQHCGKDLGDSVSDDFCSPECQHSWHAIRTKPLSDFPSDANGPDGTE